MCIRATDPSDGILDVADGHMQAARMEWSRLSPADLSIIRNKQDLIMTVGSRYNLSHSVAIRDVESWDARVRGMSAQSVVHYPPRAFQ